jgi:hypothetical protein
MSNMFTIIIPTMTVSWYRGHTKCVSPNSLEAVCVTFYQSGFDPSYVFIIAKRSAL